MDVEAVIEKLGWQRTSEAGGVVFRVRPVGSGSHEIHGVCRGVGVECNGLDMVGEGMGLGAAICVLNGRTIFSLSKEEQMQPQTYLRAFHMDGLSAKKIAGLDIDKPYRLVRKALAPLYIRSQGFRPIYTYLMWARTALGPRAVYKKLQDIGVILVSYRFVSQGVLDVEVDPRVRPDAKVMIANELSGRYFTQLFLDNKMVVEKIPPWMNISSESAVLYSPLLKLGLKVSRVEGCEMYAGREVVGQRLNWAGFSYAPCSSMGKISYRVEMVSYG